MSFDIDTHFIDGEADSQSSFCFQDFNEVVTDLLIFPYGSRVFEDLKSLCVDELDLPEQLINLLNEQQARSQELDKKSHRHATPTKSMKQD